MDTTLIQRGAIVRARRLTGVAFGEADGGIVVLPVKQTGCRHRADVRHDEPLLATKAVVRAGHPRVIRSALTALGRVSDALVEKIEATMQREAEVRAFEERFMASSAFDQARA